MAQCCKSISPPLKYTEEEIQFLFAHPTPPTPPPQTFLCGSICRYCRDQGAALRFLPPEPIDPKVCSTLKLTRILFCYFSLCRREAETRNPLIIWILFQTQRGFEMLSPFQNNLQAAICAIFPVAHRFDSQVLILPGNTLRFFTQYEASSPESQQPLLCICQCHRGHAYSQSIFLALPLKRQSQCSGTRQKQGGPGFVSMYSSKGPVEGTCINLPSPTSSLPPLCTRQGACRGRSKFSMQKHPPQCNQQQELLSNSTIKSATVTITPHFS